MKLYNSLIVNVSDFSLLPINFLILLSDKSFFLIPNLSEIFLNFLNILCIKLDFTSSLTTSTFGKTALIFPSIKFIC